MKFLKGLVLSLLSLVLFLCLSVFGLIVTLNSTLLDPDFTVAEVNKIDMPALTKEITDTYVVPQLPQELRFLKDSIYGAVSDFAPQLKQQLIVAVRSGYDYFLGKTQQLSVTISFDPLKTGLRDRMRQAFMQNLPAQLVGLPPAMADQYFNQFYQQYSQQLPPSFTLTESSLGSQTMAKVRQARQYVGYVQIAYWVLIGLMLLLIAAIVLISRDVKKATRELGVNFLIYGILGYASMFVGRYLIGQYSAPAISSLSSSLLMPKSLLSWVSQVVADVSALTSLQVFSIAVLATGVILIVVSFVYRPRPAQA